MVKSKTSPGQTYISGFLNPHKFTTEATRTQQH